MEEEQYLEKRNSYKLIKKSQNEEEAYSDVDDIPVFGSKKQLNDEET